MVKMGSRLIKRNLAVANQHHVKALNHGDKRRLYALFILGNIQREMLDERNITVKLRG